MGGSGGGYFSDIDPTDQASRIRASEQKEEDAVHETEVNAYLASELTIYNDRDSESVQDMIQKLKNDLKDEVEGTINLLFGGSISKHTYVDGLSDVDALVLFDKKELKSNSPQKLRELLSQILVERYGDKNVRTGKLAVTVSIKGQEVQLLPAQRMADSFKICSSDGKTWSQIRPQKFAKVLTEVNTKNGGKVVPTIKLAKAIIKTLPEKQQLSGYHIESMAVEIFKSYNGSMTPKAMITHFFEQASSVAKYPIKDSTGQSVHVDDYLGSTNSTQRRIVVMALDRINRKIKNANGMRSLDSWKNILGE